MAVIPGDYAPHWRHRGADCDSWSEPEGPWHLAWKQLFPEACREVELLDSDTGEWHRADIRCDGPGGKGTVLELQHSNISPEEQASREAFYSRAHRLFWLLHMHDDRGSMRASTMRLSISEMDRARTSECRGKVFRRLSWFGRSSSFIERWKTSNCHVFLDLDGRIYYLASNAACSELVGTLKAGEFALHQLSPQQLVDAVQWQAA